MTNSIKPISLTKLRSIIANHAGSSLTKLNQFAMQHIAASFGKEHLVIEYGLEQPQLYSASLILNTEKIVGIFGLNRGQRELVLEFLRSLYTCVHMDFVCPDYIDHWKSEGLALDGYLDTEVTKTYKMLIEHDPKAQALTNFKDSIDNANTDSDDMASVLAEGMSKIFGSMLGSDSPLSEIFSGLNLSSEDKAFDKEVDYLTDNPNVTLKQMSKLSSLLSKGKLKKYAKHMAKYGHEMQNFKWEDDKVVPIINVVVEEKKDKYTEILSFKPNASNKIEEYFMQDDHYAQHGIKYEAPLSFDKIMVRLMNQYANGLVTPNEVTSELKPFLIRILGEKLATKVDIIETPDGFAIGVNINGLSSQEIKSKIDYAIHNTVILN